MKACAWHRRLEGPARSPEYPIRQAILAPRLATDAKMMNVLGTVRSRLNTAKATKMEMTATSESAAPRRSKRTMISM